MTDLNTLKDVLALARDAGKRVMEIYEAGEAKAQYKLDQSPLTEADMASHYTLMAGLQRLTPDIPVLSEESAVVSYEIRRHWQRFWLIDPLDGTKEFLKRNGEFTVNIALIESGTPILGIVHAPALSLSYFAAKGGGAYRQHGDDEPVAIAALPHRVGEKVRIVGSRSHGDERLNDLMKHLGGGELQIMGSSLKLCLVADGSVHLYPRLGPTMEWDTAAAHSIVLEAGGIVCDNHGIELSYNKPDMHNQPFLVLAAADKSLLDKIASWLW